MQSPLRPHRCFTRKSRNKHLSELESLFVQRSYLDSTLPSDLHRLLTGYSQYYNRRYRHVGHVFQGRHKAILCQSDPYLAELVRYIHLNPVRAKMVERPEDYPYSSHRAYIGLDPAGIVDVDPLLRRFSPRKAIARNRFKKHVAAGIKLGPLVV